MLWISVLCVTVFKKHVLVSIYRTMKLIMLWIGSDLEFFSAFRRLVSCMSMSRTLRNLLHILNGLLNFSKLEEEQPLQTSASWKLLSFLPKVHSRWPMLMLYVSNEIRSCKRRRAVSFCMAGAFLHSIAHSI